MPLVILALGIVVLFILIIGVKLNSFLSLILVSLGVGLAEGLPLLKVFDSIESGVRGTLGHLAFPAFRSRGSRGIYRRNEKVVDLFFDKMKKHYKWLLLFGN